MKLAIRPAREEDVPALITLQRRAWLVTWAPEIDFSGVQWFAANDPATPYTHAHWPELTVIEADGKLAGMLQVDGNSIAIVQLDPAMMRRGLGTRLMDEAEAHIARAYVEARLDVRAFNTGAIAFYLQRGWAQCGRYAGSECGVQVETIQMVKRF